MEIKRKIEEALRRAAEIDASRVTVETNGGEVILRGTVGHGRSASRPSGRPVRARRNERGQSHQGRRRAFRFFMRNGRLIRRFRIDNPRRFRLADHDPAETAGFEKDVAESITLAHVQRMTDLQQRLYAQHSWALLIILQGVDAAGKDSAIKRVMVGLNPQGCVVHPFKVPTAEELDHDFLWRAARRLPARGDIGIFNRSYYEEVLVVRVHQELLKAQRLPPGLVTRRIWDERFADVNAFERYLLRNGTALIKFHLQISKEEQRRRLLARLNDPSKVWKASMADVAERKLWTNTWSLTKTRSATPARRRPPGMSCRLITSGLHGCSLRP